MSEHGYVVVSRSTAAVAVAAEQFLRRCAPEHLSSGEALDLATLVDRGLQREQIMVYPASTEELPDAEAETRAGAGKWIEILMREEFFDALFHRTSNTLRARSTVAHEIGHAVLHANEIRHGRRRPQAFALRRARRKDLKPFQDSEWQAHTFAGAFLLPRSVLRRFDLSAHDVLAGQFQVSEAFVRSHLRRIMRVL